MTNTTLQGTYAGKHSFWLTSAWVRCCVTHLSGALLTWIGLVNGSADSKTAASGWLFYEGLRRDPSARLSKFPSLPRGRLTELVLTLTAGIRENEHKGTRPPEAWAQNRNSLAQVTSLAQRERLENFRTSWKELENHISSRVDIERDENWHIFVINSPHRVTILVKMGIGGGGAMS